MSFVWSWHSFQDWFENNLVGASSLDLVGWFEGTPTVWRFLSWYCLFQVLKETKGTHGAFFWTLALFLGLV